MEINRALKRIRKKENIFFIIMGILSVLIPTLAYLANLKNTFVYVYIAIIEFLILIAMLARINICTLKFKYYNSRFKIRQGLFLRESIILCDNVAIVHTNKDREELEIIIVTSSKFRNKKSRPIVKGFLKRYPEVEREYNRLKKINEEQTYYFQIIRNGSLRKYIFLENIYTTCVKSAYTPAAIESIKIARGQINFNERG
ncbi:hypothetical protein [uncultured Clostridium sp.]|uniref:hypothetical protein n=1 Tax=uncultured Clostridium sp. TaxID=59620 RepID=UPI002670EB28|nr:hypothetical protein [uncultured Clostridium sp.]